MENQNTFGWTDLNSRLWCLSQWGRGGSKHCSVVHQLINWADCSWAADMFGPQDVDSSMERKHKHSLGDSGSLMCSWACLHLVGKHRLSLFFARRIVCGSQTVYRQWAVLLNVRESCYCTEKVGEPCLSFQWTGWSEPPSCASMLCRLVPGIRMRHNLAVSPRMYLLIYCPGTFKDAAVPQPVVIYPMLRLQVVCPFWLK